MMRLVASAALVALSSNQAGLARADDTLNDVVSEAFVFADKQLSFLKEETIPRNDMFTDYTNEAGEWRTVKESNGKNITQTVWTSGMVAGMFWLQYAATGDIKHKAYAKNVSSGLEGVELLDDNDLGFQVLNSFGLGYRLTGAESYKERALNGSKSLYEFRYEEVLEAFWSWENPSQVPHWDIALNVDMIMNMEIMLWAAENGGDDETYLDAVAAHADTTWYDLVRDDHSTYHVAAYDPDTWELVDQGTYQGYLPSSTWSRGQAWAVYGFAMVYRYLGEPRFLERSKLLLGYFVENLPADNVAFADFNAPKDALNPKDSSATAIVASALLELFEHTGEPYYLEKGQEYMSSLLLNGDYFNSTATDGWEALLRRSAAAWGEPETGSVTGDYFLLETMVRYKTMAPSILLRDETEFSTATTGAGGSVTFSKLFEDDDLAHDVDISGLNDDSPVMIWFGVTLSNVEHYPVNLIIEGEGDDDGSDDGTVIVPVTIPAPVLGWKTGENTISFSVDAGTFSKMDEVEEILLVFDRMPEGVTGVIVDYLIVGHELETSRTPVDFPAETPAPTSGGASTMSPTASSGFDTAAPTAAPTSLQG